MSFVYKDLDSYGWPVEFYQPENGTRKKQSFTARFKELKQTRINEIQVLVQKRVKSIQEGEEDTSGITDQSIADEVLVGWEDVEDGEGNPILFSNKIKKQLLDKPMLASAIIESYFDSLVEAKAKN
jgi:hypothetical protein